VPALWGRKRPRRVKPLSDALSALAHRGIRKADRRERGQPLAHVDLDANQRRLDAGQASGENSR
jgi:hypothetical protein